MIQIGRVNKLVVCAENSSGYFLKSSDSDEEIFMPPSLGPKFIQMDQELEVFVYTDSTDALIATTEIPHTLLDEYGFMDVVDTPEFGAFFDWGIKKDLLVPDTEQKERINQGQGHIVRVCIDERTNRIYGTTKLGKYIETSVFDIKEGDKVKLIPAIDEELGFRCIINKKYIGMIYHNEIFTEIETGVEIDGVIKKIRDDGLVDAALQVQGIKNLVDSKDVILNYLELNGGSSPLYDKSSPDDIKEALQMSKQTFKKTIGMLYRDRKITISKDGIKLVK